MVYTEQVGVLYFLAFCAVASYCRINGVATIILWLQDTLIVDFWDIATYCVFFCKTYLSKNVFPNTATKYLSKKVLIKNVFFNLLLPRVEPVLHTVSYSLILLVLFALAFFSRLFYSLSQFSSPTDVHSTPFSRLTCFSALSALYVLLCNLL